MPLPGEVIYAIADMDDRIRYIGHTRLGLHARLRAHRTAKTAVGEWLRSIDCEVRIFILEEWNGGEPWPGIIERDWIKLCREEGCDLFNVWPPESTALSKAHIEG